MSVATQALVWSPYQEHIFDFVANGEGSAVIEAYAGSAKTTTIVEAARRLSPDVSACMLAFNKRIAEELQRRLPAYVPALTLNALGNRAWTAYCEGVRPELDTGKVPMLVKTMTSNVNAEYMKGVRRLVDLARNVGIVPHNDLTAMTNDHDDLWWDVIEEYGVDFGDGDHGDDAIVLARRVLIECIRMGAKKIDFNDQLYLPVVFSAPFPKYDLLFVDEAQDVNRIQLQIIEACVGKQGRLIAVGDPNQCQPAGTLVRTVNGYSRIEDLNDGDRVVSVDISHSCFKASGDKIKVAQRQYEGVMTTISSGGRISRYTADHKCIVLAKPLANKYAVYLMQKGTNFRIGSTKFGIQNGCGVRQRLLSEKADRAWIISLHDTKQEAVLREALLASTYNIPERTFISQTPNGEKGLNQTFLDEFWQFTRDCSESAQTLLDLHNREYAHPFVDKDMPFDFTVRRPSSVRACNILEGMLVLHDEEKVHYKKHAWKPIEQVIRNNFSGIVYSLNVANKHTYIADGIATNNCIYQFRGAGADAMNELKRHFGAVTLPLPVCYRCPRSVVKRAQEYVPKIEWWEQAGEGVVKDIPVWGPQLFESTDVVLCRNNAPLVKLAFRLIRNRIACRMLGRDIGAGLAALVRKMKALSITDLKDKLKRHYDREWKKAYDAGRPEDAEPLADKIATINVFAENAQYVDALLKEIEALFADDIPRGCVTLSSIHKFKGGEAPRVFLLDQHLIGARGWTPAEQNVKYVALTRSQRELYFINTKEA